VLLASVHKFPGRAWSDADIIELRMFRRKSILAIWPIAKSLQKRHEPSARTAIHGPLGLNFHPSEKANAISYCLENQFTHHDLCDEYHERRVEARVQALLEAVNNKPPERIRPCELQKLINSLKLRNSRGIDGVPNKCLRQLPRRPLVL
jgi:hypothetical protein